MFTGIVQAVGRIVSMEPLAEGIRMTFDTATLSLEGVDLGGSIAVNGVCLTVIALGAQSFSAEVSRVTLEGTTGWVLGRRINLERALRLSDALGGHLVTGHVDGVGRVRSFTPCGESMTLQVEAPGDLPRYIATKGSVTVQGVSLTVNAVEGALFTVNLIPHTQQVTTLGALVEGDGVNLEVDLLARYAERARQWSGDQGTEMPPLE
ncbi:riboflavin synthase [Ferrovum sp.]|uniref:riboflavin synthase n=1 Tax=Ferrovum sp. TaxID=2609467 RepID=UPI00260A83B4|nr:riboflavin synthase [Ferrovum sp.]